VPTLDGAVVLSVPPSSGSGKKLRLRGRGMAHGPAADAKRGDMYALLRVEVPKQLTPEERALVEQLQSVSTFSPRAAQPGPAPHRPAPPKATPTEPHHETAPS
jgi:curved DNA-binding protein